MAKQDSFAGVKIPRSAVYGTKGSPTHRLKTDLTGHSGAIRREGDSGKAADRRI